MFPVQWESERGGDKRSTEREGCGYKVPDEIIGVGSLGVVLVQFCPLLPLLRFSAHHFGLSSDRPRPGSRAYVSSLCAWLVRRYQPQEKGTSSRATRPGSLPPPGSHSQTVLGWRAAIKTQEGPFLSVCVCVSVGPSDKVVNC